MESVAYRAGLASDMGMGSKRVETKGKAEFVGLDSWQVRW